MSNCYNYYCSSSYTDNEDDGNCGFDCSESKTCPRFVESMKEMAKVESEDTYEGMEFIWGIKSYDDLSSMECNINTMNDIELIRISDELDSHFGKYFLSIETIYDFQGEDILEKRKHAVEYLEILLAEFEKYCTEHDIDTHYVPHIFFIFNNNMGGVSDYYFDSIEEAFAVFKMFVKGYSALLG